MASVILALLKCIIDVIKWLQNSFNEVNSVLKQHRATVKAFSYITSVDLIRLIRK